MWSSSDLYIFKKNLTVIGLLVWVNFCWRTDGWQGTIIADLFWKKNSLKSNDITCLDYIPFIHHRYVSYKFLFDSTKSDGQYKNLFIKENNWPCCFKFNISFKNKLKILIWRILYKITQQWVNKYFREGKTKNKIKWQTIIAVYIVREMWKYANIWRGLMTI